MIPCPRGPLAPTLQTAMSHGLRAHEDCSMKPETERGSTTHLRVCVGHFQASGLCFEWPEVLYRSMDSQTLREKKKAVKILDALLDKVKHMDF